MNENSSLQYSYSWTILTESNILKKIDRSVLLYMMTGIPIDIRWFFGIESLQPGGRKEVTLFYNGKPYDGVIVMGVQQHPRSRLTWRADFAKEMSKRFPQEYNLFKSGSNEVNVIHMNFYKKTPNVIEVFLQ